MVTRDASPEQPGIMFFIVHIALVPSCLGETTVEGTHVLFRLVLSLYF